MASVMTIGDFSQATRLSAKTLRFYHHAGLLLPASIDPSNGYRLYGSDQIADAQVIRQLRALSVPVDTIRSILVATDVETRNDLIAAHLERMEAELEATRAAVRSLRGLLVTAPTPLVIEHRSNPTTPALVIRETIDLPDLGEWYTSALAELNALSQNDSLRAVGPKGGIWDTELFLHERGDAALFCPIASSDGHSTPNGRVQAEMLPAVDLAVATHRGPDETIGQTYGELGAYVAEHEIGVGGPIRENYLTDVVTEIGWPIFRTGR